MTIIFFSGGEYIKCSPNWTGVIPQIGDIVLLYFGNNNEEKRKYKVVGRTISEIDHDYIGIYLEWIDKK